MKQIEINTDGAILNHLLSVEHIFRISDWRRQNRIQNIWMSHDVLNGSFCLYFHLCLEIILQCCIHSFNISLDHYFILLSVRSFIQYFVMISRLLRLRASTDVRLKE